MNTHKRMPEGTPVSWYRKGDFHDYKVYGRVKKDNGSMAVTCTTNEGKDTDVQRSMLEVRG